MFYFDCFKSGDYSVVLGLHDQDESMGDPETFTVDTITKVSHMLLYKIYPLPYGNKGQMIKWSTYPNYHVIMS